MRVGLVSVRRGHAPALGGSAFACRHTVARHSKRTASGQQAGSIATAYAESVALATDLREVDCIDSTMAHCRIPLSAELATARPA